MTESKAEVEIEWVKIKLFPEILKNKHFREDNSLRYNTEDKVKVQDVQVKFIGSEEAFMLTNCYRAIVTFEEANSGSKTTTLIVKKTPNLSPEKYDAVQFDQLFSNEILSYNTIFPSIEKLGQQTFSIPRFYFGELHTNSATVVLQDFAAGNWRIAKQKANLSLAHALVAVSNLGTFHGTGFALRHNNRDEFIRLTKDLKEPRYSVDDIHPEWKLKTKFGAERVVIATRKHQPQIDEEFLKRFQRLVEEFILFGRKMVAPVEPLVTLCHGDYLRSNIAFKYAELNGTEEPTDSLMFDLQTIRISSPMLDLCTFLSLSTYAAVRHTHFDRIFDEYYQQLVTTFQKCTKLAQIPDYLTRQSMLREYARLFPYGISIASFFLMQLVVPINSSSEEFLSRQLTTEEIRQDSLKCGGEEVDRELSSQMKELYEFIQEYKLDIFKGFDYI